MKKKSIILLIVGVILLSGCGNKNLIDPNKLTCERKIPNSFGMAIDRKFEFYFKEDELTSLKLEVNRNIIENEAKAAVEDSFIKTEDKYISNKKSGITLTLKRNDNGYDEIYNVVLAETNYNEFESATAIPFFVSDFKDKKMTRTETKEFNEKDDYTCK